MILQSRPVLGDCGLQGPCLRFLIGRLLSRPLKSRPCTRERVRPPLHPLRLLAQNVSVPVELRLELLDRTLLPALRLRHRREVLLPLRQLPLPFLNFLLSVLDRSDRVPEGCDLLPEVRLPEVQLPDAGAGGGFPLLEAGLLRRVRHFAFEGFLLPRRRIVRHGIKVPPP